jgi:putative ABC transport system ATP-binding protein
MTDTTGQPIVEGRQIRKVYQSGLVRHEALRGVDLRVERGEMVAIMGPSGCGKTTLLNCLSGLDDVDDGDVLIEGVSLAGMSDHDRTNYRARRMGFAFQSYNLLPVLSALENVELPLLVAGVAPREARQRALQVLEEVGLEAQGRNRPNQLSGGQQQRVAIARALVGRPAIIWADEPTGNLDSEAAEDILLLLDRLNRERGQTFVIVTHAADVGARAHRIVRMRDGHIVKEEVPARPAERALRWRRCSASPWIASWWSCWAVRWRSRRSSAPWRCATGFCWRWPCATCRAAGPRQR